MEWNLFFQVVKRSMLFYFKKNNIFFAEALTYVNLFSVHAHKPMDLHGIAFKRVCFLFQTKNIDVKTFYNNVDILYNEQQYMP